MSFMRHKQDYDYFDSFCQVGKLASDSAEYLHRAITSFQVEKINTYVEEMHKLEHAADERRHELNKQLAREFMPPIEREDISTLSQELDNVVDTVEDIIRKIYMFNIDEMRSEALEFAQLIMDTCAVFYKLLQEFADLKKSKKIQQYIIEINTLENKGDKLHTDSIRRLFTDTVSPHALLAWTVIFDAMENALDACENTADIIDSTITKNT